MAIKKKARSLSDEVVVAAMSYVVFRLFFPPFSFQRGRLTDTRESASFEHALRFTATLLAYLLTRPATGHTHTKKKRPGTFQTAQHNHQATAVQIGPC